MVAMRGLRAEIRENVLDTKKIDLEPEKFNFDEYKAYHCISSENKK